MWCDELGRVVYWVDSRHLHIVCRRYNRNSAGSEWWGMHANELSDWCPDSDPHGVADESILSMGASCFPRLHLHGCDTGDSR